MSKKDNIFSIENLKESIIDDVIKPGFKNLLSSLADSVLTTISDSVDVALFGERRKNGSSRRNVSYSKYYEKGSKDEKKSSRKSIELENGEFDTRYEAEEVLDTLRDLLEEADDVSIADYYEIMGVSHTYMDRRYGWTNLSNAYVSKNRYGEYVINLPKPKILD